MNSNTNNPNAQIKRPSQVNPVQTTPQAGQIHRQSQLNIGVQKSSQQLQLPSSPSRINQQRISQGNVRNRGQSTTNLGRVQSHHHHHHSSFNNSGSQSQHSLPNSKQSISSRGSTMPIGWKENQVKKREHIQHEQIRAQQTARVATCLNCGHRGPVAIKPVCNRCCWIAVGTFWLFFPLYCMFLCVDFRDKKKVCGDYNRIIQPSKLNVLECQKFNERGQK